MEILPNYTVQGQLPSTGTPNHTQIIDSSDSTYVHVRTDQSGTDIYRMNAFCPALTINSVSVKIRIKNTRSIGADVGTIALQAREVNGSYSAVLSQTISTPNGNINTLTYTMTTCPLTGTSWRPEDILNCCERISLTLTNPGDYHTYVYRVWVEVDYDSTSLCDYDVLVPIADYQGGSGTDYQKVDDAMWARDGDTFWGPSSSKDVFFTITPFNRKCYIERVSAIWNLFYSGSIGSPSSTGLKILQSGTAYIGATFFTSGYYNRRFSYRIFDTNPYTGAKWKPPDLLQTKIGAYFYKSAYGGFNSDVMYVIVYYRKRYPQSKACVV
jgi:hypothetical protein